MQIIQYDGTIEEQERIVEEKQLEGLVLVHIANITEGNFLGFMENPKPSPTPVEQQLTDLKKQNLILMDAIATLFEEILMLQM